MMQWISTFGILLLGAACTSGGQKTITLSPQETQGELRNGFAVLVDVREEDEVRAGMAEPAQWSPLSKLESNPSAWKEFTAKLPKDKRIILYCRSGRRSGIVAAKLAAEGFKTGNMGGFEDWVKAGYPTRKP